MNLLANISVQQLKIATQRFMAANNFQHRVMQRLQIQFTGEAEAHSDIKRWIAGRELIGEPELLLGGGSRQ